MPALPNQPNVLRVDVGFFLGGDLSASSRFFFKYTGTPPTNANCDTFATNILASAGGLWIPEMTDDKSLEHCSVIDLSSPTSGVGAHAAHTVGTRAGGNLPAADSVLIAHLIARRYRGGKPRTYYPWGSSNDLATALTWLPASVTEFQFAHDSFITSIVGSTAGATVIQSYVSISYYLGFTLVVNPLTGRGRNVPTPRPSAVAADLITSSVVRPHVGSQRRRNAAA